MFTNHSNNYKSELQHKHFLPVPTQFNPWHLGYLCLSFTLGIQVHASGMIPSAAYVIVTANCIMSFLPSKLFLTLTASTCHPLIKFLTIITWGVAEVIVLWLTVI